MRKYLSGWEETEWRDERTAYKCQSKSWKRHRKISIIKHKT